MRTFALFAPFLLACGLHAGFDPETDAGATGSVTPPGTGTTDPPNTVDGGKADTGTPTQQGKPSLEMVSGDGSTVSSGWPGGDPMRVRARDAMGNPVPNASITFTPKVGNALHLRDVVNGVIATDANGIASVTYNAFGIPAWLGFERDTVTASWNGLTVDFGIIITQVPPNTLANAPLFELDYPSNAPQLGVVKAGSTTKGALLAAATFQQGPSQGQAVPNWGLRITSADDLLEPSDIACVGGTVLSDAQGKLSCDLVAPKKPGQYNFQILAGGQIRWTGHLEVTP
jgi:hypothetical protein